jgi:AcrR family transcriptional regulator
MGRPSTFEDIEVFAAVGARLARAGKVTFPDLVADTGLSVGSLYHRFASREALLAEAWLDSLAAFHALFIAALKSGDDAAAGERAALATPHFCRAERGRALVLQCCRVSELVSPDTPRAFRKKISAANAAATGALRDYSKRSGISLEALRYGVVAFPLGAVRLYLPARTVPKSVDGFVAAAYRAAAKNSAR